MDRIKKYEPLWGSWYIDKKIGEGSFGSVYQVTRKTRKKIFTSAVKLISIPKSEKEIQLQRRKNRSEESIRSYYDKQVDRLEQEIIVMEAMKSASNIVTIEDFMIVPHSDDNGNPVIGYDVLIRMEYLQNLEDYLEDHTPDEQEVIRMGVDLCRALEHCEKKRIIHRDIKPGNVFRNEFGEFKIGDFGISRQMDHTTKATSAGTPLYMAPEILRYEEYNQNADIYSLGLMMYQMLNHNRLPFMPDYPGEIWPDDNEIAVKERLTGRNLPRIKGTSRELESIIIKAAAFDKKERYQNASEMLEDLSRCLADKKDSGEKDLEPAENVEPIEIIDSERYIDITETMELAGDGGHERNLEPEKNLWIIPEPSIPATEPPSEEKRLISGSLAIGNTISFGSYQSDITDEKKPITWIILDKKDKSYLLLSEYGLECQPYNIKTKRLISWEKCSLRTWLNQDFYNTAFTEKEKSMIRDSQIKADSNPEYDTKPGKDTEDKIFLLGISDATDYFSSDDGRKCKPTDHAVDNGTYTSSSGNCWWWLRSPGYTSNYAAIVLTDGRIFNYGHNARLDYGAVRPAIWITP